MQIGAGMSNILFCKPGTPVVEVMMQEPCFRDYMHAAAALDLPFWALRNLPPNSYQNRVVVDSLELGNIVERALLQVGRETYYSGPRVDLIPS
jgi:hypothetical protein